MQRAPYPVIKRPAEIERMRRSGRLVGRILHVLRGMVRPGVTTRDLSDRAEQMIRAAGAKPLFKDYPNPAGPRFPRFPAVICSSVNDVIVHGIPDRRPLAEGDIVSIDCGVRLDGYVGDAAVTVPVGPIAPDVQQLLEDTQTCLRRAIEACQVGNRLGDIGWAVQSYAEPRGYGIVRDYCGHGVGKQMHEEPQVPNYGEPGKGIRLRPGICIAIEPMINLGTHETMTLSDHWTVVTKDRRPSAHFEHSIAIMEEGPLILTAYDPATETDTDA
jgi:methionyl aminopeptidase